MPNTQHTTWLALCLTSDGTHHYQQLPITCVNRVFAQEQANSLIGRPALGQGHVVRAQAFRSYRFLQDRRI